MINVLLIALLVVITLLLLLVIFGLVIQIIPDFQFGDYISGIVNMLVALLVILFLVLAWIALLPRLY